MAWININFAKLNPAPKQIKTFKDTVVKDSDTITVDVGFSNIKTLCLVSSTGKSWALWTKDNGVLRKRQEYNFTGISVEGSIVTITETAITTGQSISIMAEGHDD